MEGLFLAALTCEVLFNFSYFMTNNPHNPVFKTNIRLWNSPTGGRVSHIRRMVLDLSELQQMKWRNKSSYLSSALIPDQKKPKRSTKVCWSAKAEQKFKSSSERKQHEETWAWSCSLTGKFTSTTTSVWEEWPQMFERQKCICSIKSPSVLG